MQTSANHLIGNIQALPPIIVCLWISGLFIERSHFGKADREIALPPSVAGVGIGQTLVDAEAFSKAAFGIGKVPLRHRQTSQPAERDGKPALPMGIARVGIGQTLTNVVRVGKSAFGISKVSLRHRQIAQPAERDGEVALP